MDVLVTGATGFVGSHLVERLIRRGDRVRALVRSARATAFGANVVVGDLDDGAGLATAVKGCEVVYHCAARVEVFGGEDEFHRTNVAGTGRLLRAAAEAGVRRFVHVSSCGVYPPALLARGAIVDEHTPVPEPPRWFRYGRAKYLAEKVVRDESPPGMEWVIVRLGYLYGPRNRTMKAYLEPVLRDRIMMIVGRGDNDLALVYVEDAAEALARAGSRPGAAGQVLIVGPDERVTQRDYVDALADGFGVPRITKHVPYAVAFFFGWLGERFVRRGHRRAALCRSAIALTGLPQRLDCERTRALLDWRPTTSFAEGMRRTFEWYRQEYGSPAVNAAASSVGVR